jgi:hypothetical protein
LTEAKDPPDPTGCDKSGIWGPECAVAVRYLDMAVYFGPLEVPASSCPGGDIPVRGQPFLSVPGGDEVVACLHARMGGPVQVVKYLPAEVPGYQRLEHAFGSFTDEVQIAD